ncbi:MAG: HWE histidine kinase domain-containing protein [Sphingobium sp.]
MQNENGSGYRPELAEAVTTNAHLKAILSSAVDAIITIDDRRRITFLNPAAERMFTTASERSVGQSIDRFIPVRFRGWHAEQWANIDKSEDPARPARCPFTTQAMTEDGREFPVEVTVSRGNVGREQFSTIIMRDVSEREAEDEARNLLAREVDHRAKNALALVQAIVSMSSATTQEGLVGAVEGRIAAISRAHSRLARNQWHGGELEQIVRDELSGYLRPTQLLCEGPSLFLKPKAVQSVALLFHELVTNAVKYGALVHKEGRIAVRWGLSVAGGLRIEWQETDGPPVLPPQYEGFGTTLIAKVVGQQLHGRVSVDYLPHGVRMVATLPASILQAQRPSPDGAEEQADLPIETPNHGDGRILIVDDELLIAMQMRDVLSASGWDVMGPATNLVEAMSLIEREGAPDAAVLDVNLDGVSVTPLVELLDRAGVAVVLCTGYEDVREPELAGHVIVRKPANSRQLLAGIDRAVQQKQQEQRPRN